MSNLTGFFRSLIPSLFKSIKASVVFTLTDFVSFLLTLNFPVISLFPSPSKSIILSLISSLFSSTKLVSRSFTPSPSASWKRSFFPSLSSSTNKNGQLYSSASTSLIPSPSASLKRSFLPSLFLSSYPIISPFVSVSAFTISDVPSFFVFSTG